MPGALAKPKNTPVSPLGSLVPLTLARAIAGDGRINSKREMVVALTTIMRYLELRLEGNLPCPVDPEQAFLNEEFIFLKSLGIDGKDAVALMLPIYQFLPGKRQEGDRKIALQYFGLLLGIWRGAVRVSV